MGAWRMRSFCRKNHAHKIPRWRGGGAFWVLLGGGGGKCRFFFYGREDFSDIHRLKFVSPPAAHPIKRARSLPPPYFNALSLAILASFFAMAVRSWCRNVSGKEAGQGFDRETKDELVNPCTFTLNN